MRGFLTIACGLVLTLFLVSLVLSRLTLVTPIPQAAASPIELPGATNGLHITAR